MNSENKRPILIDPLVRQEMQQKVELESISQTKYVKDFFKDMYYNYVKPNYGVIICILLIFLLLYIRYTFIKKDREPEKMVKDMELKEMMLREQQKKQSMQQHIQQHQMPANRRMHLPLRQDGMPVGQYGGQYQGQMQEQYGNIQGNMESGESFNLVQDPRSPYYGGDPFSRQNYDDMFMKSVPLVDAFPQRPMNEINQQRQYTN